MDLHTLIHMPRSFWKAQYKKALILTYHRISTSDNDPHLLSVTPEHFSEQMEYISEHYTVIRLSELHNSIITNRVSDRSIVITFDDGYADNLLNAKPILEKYNLPATVFVVSGHIGIDKEFWWDKGVELNHIIHRTLTLKELKELDRGLVEIGAHTITHPILSQQSDEVQKREIIDGKQELEKILNHPIQNFSYPYGERKHFNKHTINAVKEAGFLSACTTYQTTVTCATDTYRLPRVGIRNWNIDLFSRKIKDWFNE